MPRTILFSATTAITLAFATPPAAKARRKKLDEVILNTKIQNTRSANPWQQVARLEVLARHKRPSKTSCASVLYRIAALYGNLAPDKPRAVATYRDTITSDPKHPTAERAKTNINERDTQVPHIRKRDEQGQDTVNTVNTVDTVDDRMSMGECETIISQMKAR